MRLIDADALYIEIMDRGIDGLQLDDLSEIQQVVDDAPSVDAVPVVRCKDCLSYDKANRLCTLFFHEMYEDDFCSRRAPRL